TAIHIKAKLTSKPKAIRQLLQPIPNPPPTLVPPLPRLYFFTPFFSCESFTTFLTIFCSSIKKARTILSRTQLPHREPPYAREMLFCGRETVAYSRGRRAGIYRYECEQKGFGWCSAGKRGPTPGSLIPQSPHFGGDPRF